MTIPMVVMVVSGATWLLLMTTAKPANENEWPNFHRWLKEFCRILFAVSAFWVLAGVSGRTVF